MLTVFLLTLTSLISIYYFTAQEKLGTLGDFVGGILNPVMSFITIIFLIHTILQNQETIKQNQVTIDLNTDELKNSTRELSLSQKALTEDTVTNKLKFNFDLIERIEFGIKAVMSKNEFISDIDLNGVDAENPDYYSFEYVLTEMVNGDGWNFGEEDFIFFSLNSTDNILITFKGLYEAYIESANFIISESPAMKTYFDNYTLTNELHSLYVTFYSERNKDNAASWIFKTYQDFRK